MRKQNDLGRDPIRPLVWRIAFPSMLAQFVSVLYSIVDRMYIGHIPQVGDLALAGVGVCGPVVTMIGSAASLIGVGGAPLMSMRMGEGETEQARRILANCFLMLCVLSVVYAGHGVKALQEAGIFGAHPVAFFEFDWLGIHPDAWSLAAQGLALAGVLLLYGRSWLRQSPA